MARTPNPSNYFLGEGEIAFRRYQLFNEIYQPATAERFVSLPLSTDMHILEVGCGIGATACYMAKEIVPDGHVTAFDQSAELVAIAKQQASAAGIRNITFFCAKAQEFDCDGESFDLAHTRYVLSYSPYARDVLRRLYDALKPSGILFGEEIAQVYIRHNSPQWLDDLGHWFAKLIEAGGGAASYGLERMPGDMLQAGFKNLTVTAHCPIEDQDKILEMLRLALSKEMRDNLINLNIASAEEIDAAAAAMQAPRENVLIGTSMVVQVTGRKS